MVCYTMLPQNATSGQLALLDLLKNVNETDFLPEMYPLGIGQFPEVPATFDEIVELQRAGLILFNDYIKNVENKAFNAYLIRRGANLKTFEQQQLIEI